MCGLLCLASLTEHVFKARPRCSECQCFIPFYINKFILIVYLFLAALGLCCCARGFSGCGEWGLLFIAVSGLLIAVASLIAEPGL